MSRLWTLNLGLWTFDVGRLGPQRILQARVPVQTTRNSLQKHLPVAPNLDGLPRSCDPGIDQFASQYFGGGIGQEQKNLIKLGALAFVDSHGISGFMLWKSHG